MLLQVVGLTTAIGVIRGTGSEAFAVGLVFSIVVRDLNASMSADSCSWRTVRCHAC